VYGLLHCKLSNHNLQASRAKAGFNSETKTYMFVDLKSFSLVNGCMATAVRLGKKSRSLHVGAQKYMLCAKMFVVLHRNIRMADLQSK
jgi:hypothetical protein